MSDQLSIILLAAGPGAVIGLLALGLITIYRSSSVLYLAQPATATVGGYLYYEMAQPGRLYPLPALFVSALVTGFVSVLVYVLAMRPLAATSPVTKLVASVGVTQIFLGLLYWRYGEIFYQLPPVLPQGPVYLPFDVVIGIDRLLLITIAVVVTAILWAIYRFTRFGVATSAVAESPFFAGVFGLGAGRLAIANWFVAGVLAGGAGALLAPVLGLSLAQLTELLVPVLAAALIGSMTSFPLALLGGTLIAVLQAEVQATVDVAGAVDLVPFIALLLVMMIRGQGAPIRNFTAPRLPAVGSGRMRWLVAIGLGAVFLVSVYTWIPVLQYRPLLTSLTMAVVLLSLVVVTGYAGQLSLAQFTIAGVGAFCAGHVAADLGWSFVPAMAVGVVLAALAGMALAIPAIRMKGVNFAVITLGFAVVLYSSVLNRTEQLPIDPPSILGLDISMITAPRNYLAVTFIALFLAIVVVANLRRSATGLRMIAVRGNERAASSLGINVTWTKAVAFGVSGGIAGLGGVLLAFQTPTLSFEGFTPLVSTELISWATVGGIGVLAGPLVGTQLAPGSLGTSVGTAIYDNTAVLGFVGGILLILTLMVHPDGVASIDHRVRELFRRLFRRPARVVAPLDASVGREPTSEGKPLAVEGVSVRFGGVQALADVSFTVQPGTVHGLIGSNGAGKTTLLDVVSGFTKPADGRVRLAAEDLGHLPAWRRARLGFGRSFQNGQLLADLTVAENLRVAGVARGGLLVKDLVVPSKVELTPTAVSAVRTLELGPDMDSIVEDLSHGKRQLVSIARALSTAPSFVLLDEPAAGLSEPERDELAVLLRHLARDLNIGILLVEHDVELVLRVCDVVTVLDNGRVIAEGTPEAIRGSAEVQRAYLGAKEAELEAEVGQPEVM